MITAPVPPTLSGPLSPFVPEGPAAPVVPLTHAAPEPAENEPRVTMEEAGGIANIALPGCPHPFYRLLLHWTPAFVPSLEGALALALALMLIFRGSPLAGNLDSFGGILVLFAIYLVAGTLFGLVLYFAASDAIWFSALVIGALLLPSLIFAPLLGHLLGAGAIALSIVLAVITLLSRRTAVPDDAVAVTKLFGRYFRVIRQGHFLRLPGERVVATLRASERVYTTPTVSIELDSPAGVAYRAHAVCTATYAILPAEAQRIVPALATWEQDLQQQLIRALHEALTDWATHAILAGAPPPQGTLARLVMGDVRRLAQMRGIWLKRVRVHNIWLEPLAPGGWAPTGPLSSSAAFSPSGSSYPNHQPASQPRSLPGVQSGPQLSPYAHASPSNALRQHEAIRLPSSRPVAPQMSAAPGVAYPEHTRVSAPMQPVQPMQPMDPVRDLAPAPYRVDRRSSPSAAPSALAQPAVPSVGREIVPAHAAATAGAAGDVPDAATMAPDSPEALAIAYEAIRQGRITDPTTIREVADAFARAAQKPPAEPLPYDAASAAHILRAYAAKIEQHLSVSVGTAQ